MKQQNTWRRKLSEFYYGQFESAPLLPIMELCGDRRILLENHKGVKEYGKNRISICVRYGMLVICGEGLRLCRMHGQQLVIMGRIDNISVVRGNHDGVMAAASR